MIVRKVSPGFISLSFATNILVPVDACKRYNISPPLPMTYPIHAFGTRNSISYVPDDDVARMDDISP